MDKYSIHQMDFSPAYGILCAALPKKQDRDALYPTFCRVAPGDATQRHSHFEPEIFYIIQGVGQIEIEDERQSVKGGDLVRLPPFLKHVLRNTGSEILEFLSVYSEDYEVFALPDSVLLTAAPPTPNGPLHLGHISGPYLAGDVIARYFRLRDVPVHTHTGTDDHQNYVTEMARSKGESSESFRKKMRTRVQGGLKKMTIQFDSIIEPSGDESYRRKTAEFIRQAIRIGVIQAEQVDFPFCASCDNFLVDVLVEGQCPSCHAISRGGCENCGIVYSPNLLQHAKCTRCRSSAVLRKMSVLMFNLTDHLHLIDDYIDRLTLTSSLRGLIKKVKEQAELKVMVSHPDTGLGGIRLPELNQIIHVWSEMAAHYSQLGGVAETWIHCFGFDNSFHYLLFIPALLRALNPKAKLPDTVITNEFLLLDGSKFSTSREHAIWADEFQGNSDHLRLYLSLNRPVSSQSNFSLQSFKHFSTDLEIQMQRVLKRASQLTAEDRPQAAVTCNRFARDYERMMSLFDFRQASRALLSFIDFVLEQERGSLLLYGQLARAMSPFMPNESQRLLETLEKPVEMGVYEHV